MLAVRHSQCSLHYCFRHLNIEKSQLSISACSSYLDVAQSADEAATHAQAANWEI